MTRVCTEDYKIPDTDIVLEKGTSVIIPIKAIHWDEKVYEDPWVFDPERFSEENKLKRHQYAFIPFGEGPRICIGKHSYSIQFNSISSYQRTSRDIPYWEERSYAGGWMAWGKGYMVPLEDSKKEEIVIGLFPAARRF